MAWSDAAREASAMVRHTHARAIVKYTAEWRSGDAAKKHAIYKAAISATRYQHASGLRYARKGAYAKPVAVRIAQRSAAMRVLTKFTGKG